MSIKLYSPSLVPIQDFGSKETAIIYDRYEPKKYKVWDNIEDWYPWSGDAFIIYYNCEHQPKVKCRLVGEPRLSAYILDDVYNMIFI